ncbi:MAG: hypothetical protein AAF556_10105 [Pseudomonadota bacterium]
MTRLDHDQIVEILRNLSARPLGLDRDRDFRISVAGVQEKTALLRLNGQWFEPRGTTPTTHIIKPTIGQLAADQSVSCPIAGSKAVDRAGG